MINFCDTMGILRSLVLLIAALITIISTRAEPSEYVRACYWTNWSQHRLGDGQFLPEHYEPGVCTHIFYAFANMNKNFQLVPGQWNDEDGADFIGNYKKLVALKRQDPNLKILLTFGGVDFSEQNANLLHTMASTRSNRAKFINGAVEYLRGHNFDGLCLDWMYPRREDRFYFSALATEMRQTLEEEAQKSGYERLLLATTLPWKSRVIKDSFDGVVVGAQFDYVCLDTFNFHGSPENRTGFSSPLYDFEGDTMAISNAAQYWQMAGVPKSKILIGLSTFGTGWTLAAGQECTVGAPAIGPSPKLNFTLAPGIAAYYEVCDLVDREHWKDLYDEEQQAAYTCDMRTNETVWIGCDNRRSYSAKLDWIKMNGYGGVHVWALDMDDFRGRCLSSGGQKYPLLKMVKEKLAVGKTDNLSTVIGLTGNLSHPDGHHGSSCITGQKFPNPRWKDTYFECVDNRIIIQQCANGSLFDEGSLNCGSPDDIGGKNGKERNAGTGIIMTMVYLCSYFLAAYTAVS